MEAISYQEENINEMGAQATVNIPSKVATAKKRGSSPTVVTIKAKEGTAPLETAEEKSRQFLGILNLPTGYPSVAESVAHLNGITLSELLAEIIASGLEPYAMAIKTFRQKQSEREESVVN
jgi:hypothetical protein